MNRTPRTQTVLLVDDDPYLAEQVRVLLELSVPSAAVVYAPDGCRAVQVAGELRFDLCLVDVHLPDCNGLELLAQRIAPLQPDAWAVVITALPTAALTYRAWRAGAVEILPKPLDFAILQERVRAVFAPRQADGFSGTLRSLKVTDIVQIKCLSGATTTLRLEGPLGHSGRIHIECGQLAHAELGSLAGEEAMVEMLGWPGGSFEELPAIRDGRRTIYRDWQTVLIDGFRQLDSAAA